MTTAPARLVLRYGPYPAEEYPLPDHTITIGRDPVNDIVISDPEISRRHARLMFQAGRYLLEDLGSTNGTSVNGRRISEPVVLNADDVIDFAEYVAFTFVPATDALADTMLEAGRRGPSAATAVRPRPTSVSPVLPSAATARSEPPVAVRQTEPPYPPVATRQTEPFPAGAPPNRRRRMPLLIGCGCLIFFLAVVCGAALFLIDAQAPELLYCGALRPLFEPLLRLAGRALLC
jgi:pSer/pThr/pTyr-binding forkhead associated (FHA) protein